MKNIMFFLFVLYLPLAGKAQINLVVNPSFEYYTMCPDNFEGAKYAFPWTSLDTLWAPPDWAHAWGIPDYCNVCSVYPTYPNSSVPLNGYFYHYPRTGAGMMQVNMFCEERLITGGPQQFRDYLQSRLSKQLISGKTYLVTFYVSSEGVSFYSCNNIGAYFDDGTIDTTHNPGWTQTQYTPQIVETAIINDTAVGDSMTWIRIQDTFTARGTEKFITIGQFTDQAHTNFFAIKDTSSSLDLPALYLVDDVSVIDCGNIPNAGRDTLITLGDSVFIGSHELLIPYTWYVLGSSTPIDSGGGFWAHPAATTTYVVEQNLCGIKKRDTIKVWVAPVGLSELHTAVNNVRVYPNPVVNELTIDGAKGLDVAIYDVVGKEILHSAITSERQVLDISALPNGTYIVQLIDKQTGMKVVRNVLKS